MMIANMKKLTTEYILSNKEKWKDAVRIQTVVVEKIHLEKFNGRNKLTISTINGSFEIRKDDYIKSLKESADNTLYILYNVNISSSIKDGKKVKRKFMTVNNEKVLDRIVIKQSELNSLGYVKYKYGTYKKRSKKALKVFIVQEDITLIRKDIESPLRGKKGDIIVIYGNNDYMIYGREFFTENFEIV